MDLSQRWTCVPWWGAAHLKITSQRRENPWCSGHHRTSWVNCVNTRDTVRSSEWIRTTSTLFVSITVHHQSESGSDTFPFMEEVLIRFPSLLPTFMIFKFLQCWVKLSEYCSSSYDETAVVCGTDQLFPITTRPTLPRTQHSDCSVQPNECQINMESFSPLTLSP